MAADSSDNASGPSDHDRQQESSKAAQGALAAQKRAQELTQAAAGAGDPQERQRLLNEALEKEIEAESFGKTAKYLQSGTFQGMAAGTGIGVGTGAGLGALTGTLVGGTTSLLVGGLGGAIGSGVGALHGPFIKMGDVAGGAVKKVTGTIPGWEATEEQKGMLEKMIGQVKKQERPSEDDLVGMTKGGGGVERKEDGIAADSGERSKDEQTSWAKYATSYAPSLGQSGNGKKTHDTQGQQGDEQDATSVKKAKQQNTSKEKKQAKKDEQSPDNARHRTKVADNVSHPSGPSSVSEDTVTIVKKASAPGNTTDDPNPQSQDKTHYAPKAAKQQQVQSSTQTNPQRSEKKKHPPKLEVRSK